MTYQLPPLNDADKFEKLVRDILRQVYNDPGIEQFGRGGQGQHGIDGYSPAVSGVTFQCKLKDLRYENENKLRATLIAEMEEEIRKTSGLAAKPKRFIFATTFKNDTHLQQKAQLLSNAETTVEYWGWDTINERIWDYAETLIPIYFPLCPVKLVPGFIKITTVDIAKARIDDPGKRKKLALEYYKINDRDDVVFKVVCNNMDIRNTNVMADGFQKLEALSSDGTLWILGNGGSGKTTILHRFAVELSLSGQNIYMLNLEANLTRDDLKNALSQIKYCNDSGKVVLCIDNPAHDEVILELLLRLIPDYCEQIHILLSERGHRYRAMQRNGCMTYLHGEEEHDPIIVKNPRQQRQQVYNRLFELLEIPESDSKSLKEISLNERLVYVNATYTILLELKKKRKIDFDFDWDDYRRLTNDIPAFQDGYKYIALFYLFGVKAPFSLLSKIFYADELQQRTFLERFRGLENEPVIVTEGRDASGHRFIFLRTKHEIVSEIYFQEHPDLNKTDLLMECCEHANFGDLLQSQALVNIFGTKKNYLIEDAHVDYQAILDFLLNSYLVEKIKLSRKLYETLHLARFWLLLAQNKEDEAVSFLESLIREVPNNLHSRTELSKIYQRQNKLDKAEAVLLESIKIDDKQLHPRTELAKIYQRQGKLTDAERVLLRVLDIKPDDLNSRTELSKIYQTQGNLTDAERVLLKVLDIKSDDLNSRTELSKIYQRQNKLDKAEAVLEKLIEIDQKNLQARTELSKIYQRQGKFTDAERVLLKVLDIKPDDLNSRTELSKIYQTQGNLTDAERVLLKVLDIKPDDLNSRTELSKIYQRQGRLDDAEKRLKEYIELDPQGLHPRTELSKIYQRQNKLDKAEAVLLESIKIDDKQLHPRTELAKIYQRQNKLDKAEAVLLESINIDDKQLHPRTELAKIYQRQGRLDDAEKRLKEYIELDPQGLHPRTELSKIYQRQNKLDKAEAVLLESIKIDDKQLHPRTELSKIYQRQNKLDKAEAVLEKLLEIDQKNLQARTELSKIYQRQNEFDKAAEKAEEVLKIDPINSHAMSELLAIWNRMGKKEKCEQRFFDFIAQPEYRFGRHSQAPVFRFLLCCRNFDMKANAREVFQRFGHELDEQNLNYYRDNFE